jgi:hypothetical protein
MGLWLVVRYAPGHRHHLWGTGNSGTLAPWGHSCACLSAVPCTESFPTYPSNFNSLAQSRRGDINGGADHPAQHDHPWPSYGPR